MTAMGDMAAMVRGELPAEVLDAPVRGALLTRVYFESGSAALPGDAANAVAVAGVALGQAPATGSSVDAVAPVPFGAIEHGVGGP